MARGKEKDKMVTVMGRKLGGLIQNGASSSHSIVGSFVALACGQLKNAALIDIEQSSMNSQKGTGNTIMPGSFKMNVIGSRFGGERSMMHRW